VANINRTAARLRAGVRAALLLAIAGPAMAQDVGGELRRFLHDDAIATVHLRSYYFDRVDPRPPNNAALAGGGWLGYQTGWLHNLLQFGAVGYTSQPLWTPQGSDGTLLLKPGAYGYWVLGQLYGSLKLFDQTFTGYRQLVDELEVNPKDDRMTPNTFEAYALRGAIGPVSYFAGYLARMKPRNQSDFFDMATIAINLNGRPPSTRSAGMWLGSLRYKPIPSLGLRASTYYVQDILTSAYGDAQWSTPLAPGITLGLSGNFMVQGSNGANALLGQPFTTWAGGLRATLGWGDFTLLGAYTQVGDGANYLEPYGVWLGYTHQQIRDYDHANERAFQLGIAYDFKGLGLPGLTLRTSATMGNGMINPTTRAYLAQNTEFDFDAEYRFDAAHGLPDWLKPLSLRGRAGLLQTNLNGQTNGTRDFRVIVNYEITFKGDGKRSSAALSGM
jgi:hypothetical protein